MHRLAVKVPTKASFDYYIRPESSDDARAAAGKKAIDGLEPD